MAIRQSFVSRFEQSIECAAGRDGMLMLMPMPAALAARGFHALIDGLIQNWLLDQKAFDLLDVGQRAMTTYLDGPGFSVAPEVKTETDIRPGW